MRAKNFFKDDRIVSYFVFLLVTGVISSSATSKTGITYRSEPVQQGSGFVLMCLSAHPDDENGATLAYYTHIKNVKAYSIFYTRGEGGQNVIGSELYKELAEMRTEETLAASKVLGTQVYFLNFPDFGFSKTAKETFRMWGGKDSVLSRIVYMIRSLRPDVIITNHDTITTLPDRQHGNHQAVGITAYEAFEKAADPTYHPEQLRHGVTVWQVKKLFFRVLRETELKKDSLVTIPVDTKYDNETIQQVAWDALKKHRTQGMDQLDFVNLPTVFRKSVYELVRSYKKYPYDPHDLFSGILPSERKTFPVPSIFTSDLKPFSFYVSPKYSLLSSVNPHGRNRSYDLETFNRTNAPLPITLYVYFGRHNIMIKRFVLPNSERYHLKVTLKLPETKRADDSLIFAALPHPRRRSSGLRFQRDVAVLRRVRAKYDTSDNIGLVNTYDNTLQETLDAFGIRYQVLDSSSLAAENLTKFTSIVLDIRAYLYRHDLVEYNDRILDYVNNGGNVVCFYNRPPEWNGHAFAPYPINITKERVTEETQPVTVLDPSNKLFHSPNQILPSDWNGWVQERNIYLPDGDTTKTSGKYERLLAMSDEDETVPSTSLLQAKYGKGTYTYTSLALYRQVKILNEGGMKLLFNLISQPRNGN
ncbi:MAG TPA: PIG-L family deacetylase [Candidatus Acidoferrales bacterium]|nr:PIG-L family deacetylase [Candidatus Acidoferrales bacterium]